MGTFSKARTNMQEITARNIRIMSTIMTLFATVIAVGVVYNNARIALAERTWELASLRVLGFTRAEVSALLLGELAISIALALPLGMLAGNALVHALAQGLKSDPVLLSGRDQPADLRDGGTGGAGLGRGQRPRRAPAHRPPGHGGGAEDARMTL
ncbi:MAG: ABC transporter permease [Rubrivivax sp.]